MILAANNFEAIKDSIVKIIERIEIVLVEEELF